MDLIERALPLMGQAVLITLFLGITSFLIGSAIGLGVTLARLSVHRILRYLAIGYVSVVRGTPLLIQILLIYFGLPQVGLVIDPIPAAIAALSINGSAYLSENFRAGVLSVNRGQREAAHSLSMSYWQALRRVILPQAIRIALPPVGSRFIAIMKDTSLASVITVFELTRLANMIGSATFQYMQMFLIVAFVYWLINATFSAGQEVLERRLARPY
ncbi:MAG: amino acid ABC transporter permease [Geodermatophilaceae bacterium]|nr:amino acid ABC transporter permease [Geodermatophilaceae bacterium]